MSMYNKDTQFNAMNKRIAELCFEVERLRKKLKQSQNENNARMMTAVCTCPRELGKIVCPVHLQSPLKEKMVPLEEARKDIETFVGELIQGHEETKALKETGNDYSHKR